MHWLLSHLFATQAISTLLSILLILILGGHNLVMTVFDFIRPDDEEEDEDVMAYAEAVADDPDDEFWEHVADEMRGVE